MAESDWRSLAEPNHEFMEEYNKIPGGYTFNIPIPEMRERQKQRKQQMSALLGPQPPEVYESLSTVTARDGYQIPIKIYRPKTPPAKGSPLIVFFHGGGFCIGGLEGEDTNCRNFTKHYGAVCVSVDYRLAPEHPFPAAPNDAWDCVKWAAANASTTLGATPSTGFILGGTSAGGNLAAVLSLVARDHALTPPITSLALLIPSIMDASNPPAAYAADMHSLDQLRDGAGLNREGIDLFMRHYAPDPTSSLWNVFAEYEAKGVGLFAGLPPVVFQVCGADPLRDEALVYERMLRTEVGVRRGYMCMRGCRIVFIRCFR